MLDQRARAKTSETIARLSEGMARLSETKALENEKKAQENLSVACQGLDDWLTEVADVDLADIPQMERVRQRLLEKASKGYEKLARNTVDDQTPLFRWVVGRSHSRLGDILAMLGNYSKAEEFYRQGIARLQDLLGEYPGGDDYRRDLVRSHLGLAVLFKDLQRYKEAQDELTVAGTNNEPLASSTDPVDRQRRAELAYQRGVLLAHEAETSGALATPNSRIAAESEQAYREAITLQEGLAKGPPIRIEMNAKLGRYRNNLSILLERQQGPVAGGGDRAPRRSGRSGRSPNCPGNFGSQPGPSTTWGCCWPSKKNRKRG